MILIRPCFTTLLIVVAAVCGGCANFSHTAMEPVQAKHISNATFLRPYELLSAQEDQILALDPEHLTEAQIRTVLSNAPAPRVIGIHGGVRPVHLRMQSFARFLVGMGYPEFSVRHPADGTYTFSCYECAGQIAGTIAWYYEHEGLRPMIVGHSQGGMQAVKVLRKFTGGSDKRVPVWNPLTWQRENRCEIRDPLSGEMRPVVGLKIPYTATLSAGGLTRFLPNQWDMMFILRKVPDSVDEFTGFYMRHDFLGTDGAGRESSNHFKSAGRAEVRNVELPGDYDHWTTPDSGHLATDPALRDWINRFEPPARPGEHPVPPGDSRNILWAADVWRSIKRHWVLELQQLIRARRASTDGR